MEPKTVDTRRKTRVFAAAPVKREKISAGKFLALSPADLRNIKKVSIVPPLLGEDDFGCVMVEYASPVFKVK